MFNEEIYKKLEEEFAEDQLAVVCDAISVLYDIKYNASKNEDALTEFDYERDWWMNKRNELIYSKEIM